MLYKWYQTKVVQGNIIMEAWIWIILIVIIITIIVAIILIVDHNSKKTTTAPPGNGGSGGGGGGSGSATSACTQDSDCISNNCSLGFCQPGTEITRTVGAACISNSPSTSIPGCVSGLSCNKSTGQTIGVCTAGTNGYFESCISGLNQCQALNVCTTSMGVQPHTNKFCLFRSDQNVCPSGQCLSGYSCTFSSGDGKCLASSGLPCTSGNQCVSTTCGSSGVSKWNGITWSKLAPVQTGVNFDRIEAINVGSGDDIWGLDTNSGIYHLPNGQTEFTKVLSNVTQMMINGDNRTMTMVDFAVTNDNTVYILYSAPGDNQTLYPIFTIDMTGLSTTLKPFITTSGVQTAPSGGNFNQIVGMDVIIVNDGTINTVLNAQVGSDSFKQYVSTNMGNFISDNPPDDSITLSANSIVRFVPNPNLSGADQAKNVSQSFKLPNVNNEVITCIQCIAYVSQTASNIELNNPVGITDGAINDYSVTISGPTSSMTTNYYFLAEVGGKYNLYIGPTNVISMSGLNLYAGQIGILPGYYDSSTRVASNGSNVYIFSNQTCA